MTPIRDYKTPLLIVLGLPEDATDADIEEAMQARGSFALHSARPRFHSDITPEDRQVAAMMKNSIESVRRYGQKRR
jgi:hypothetical protein